MLVRAWLRWLLREWEGDKEKYSLMLMKDAVLPGTPDYVIEAYETLADRAKNAFFWTDRR